MPDSLLDELCAWLRIPSISSGGGDPADLERAAELGLRADRGGRRHARRSCRRTATRWRSASCASRRADAPTVLIYGHYDVQCPSPESEWTRRPFEPEIRDGRVYARGASDDKGNFLPLLHVACRLARAGELPVHVRVVVEGEEEIGGHHVLDWFAEDERGADCAIVFDGGMEDERTPALTIGVRGIVQWRTSTCAPPRATSTPACTAVRR